MEHFSLHIHAHLDIFINGNPYAVPSEIGIIPNQCIYWMHTHDDSGIIHIESPQIEPLHLASSLIFGVRSLKIINYLIILLEKVVTIATTVH